MFEIVARWESALDNIKQAARANGQSAKWIVGAARLNRRTIYQRYAMHMQSLTDRMPQDLLRLASI